MDCHFCQLNIKEVDFKEVETLKKFISSLGKIRSKEKSGLCSYHQRKTAKAVKRARHLGLLSSISK